MKVYFIIQSSEQIEWVKESFVIKGFYIGALLLTEFKICVQYEAAVQHGWAVTWLVTFYNLFWYLQNCFWTSWFSVELSVKDYHVHCLVWSCVLFDKLINTGCNQTILNMNINLVWWNVMLVDEMFWTFCSCSIFKIKSMVKRKWLQVQKLIIDDQINY